MKEIVWCQNHEAARAEAGGATLVAKDDLFGRSDTLSIHLKLSDRTRGLVGADELALMKSTSWLVNTSRGPIVDEAALIEALTNRSIGGGAPPPHDPPPPPAQHPPPR